MLIAILNASSQFIWLFENKIRIGNWQLSCLLPIQMLILNKVCIFQICSWLIQKMFALLHNAHSHLKCQ